jgi:hypothetical protein
MRSKAAAQLVSCAHIIDVLTLYPFHFLNIYPPSNLPLREGRSDTEWEPSKPEKKSISLNIVSFVIHSHIFSFCSLQSIIG